MMLTEYIELIESFKLYKISSLIDEIKKRIFAAFKHPKFNPLIAPYFSTIKTKDQLFTDYECDPDNVSQVKKVMNALNYAHNSFKALEQVKVKGCRVTALSELTSLWYTKVDEAFEACRLLTHLDVDLQEMFRDELQLLVSVIIQLQTLINKNSKSTKTFTDSIRNYSIAHKAGKVTGAAIEQLQPSSGSFDYEFLTTFSATLPGYINKITQYIQQYSSQLIAQEPAFNTKQLEELHDTALNLLNDLESLRGNRSIFVSLKFLKYIHIINDITTLITSSIEQIGNLSESSQDVIRDNLAQLKYYLLPQLFGLVDKIEINCMLKPGTLSTPLMEKIKPLYQSLIDYASKPVNFEKGEELLRIEDSRFLARRLENTYGRIDKANNELFRLKQVEHAYTSFFSVLATPGYEQLSLHDLSEDTLLQLTKYYKILKPFMAHVAPDLNKVIINALLGKNKAPLAYVMNKLQSITSFPSDHISLILNTRKSLEKYIEKKKNTQQFYITLNTDLIALVQKETNLVLFPYSDITIVIPTELIEKMPTYSVIQKETQLYVRNEEAVLTAVAENNPSVQFITTAQNKTIANTEPLTGDQTLALFQWYRDKLSRFHTARAAYNEFMNLIESQIKALYPIAEHVLNFNQLNEENRTQLRALYKQFRSYFIQALPEAMRSMAATFDHYLNYEPGDGATPNAPILMKFRLLDQYLQGFFDGVDSTWTKQREFYLKQTKHKYASEEQNVFLIDESRALRNAGAFDSAVKFSKKNGQKEVATPQQLTANQALILHQWYRSKRNKFLVAQKAYEEFVTLVNKQAKKDPSSNGAKFTLNKLDPNVKTECRKLYNLFQPYFINGVPNTRKQAALDFDRYLVHSFNAEELVTDKTPTIDLIEQLDEHFQTYFTTIDRSWAKKSSDYLILAQQQFVNENDRTPLKQDPNADRAHYLLKDTRYSKFLYEFRQTLQQLTCLFNQSMQAELIIKGPGIPFSELQHPHEVLAQSKQVLALKEVYNYLYHIEQIIKELEQLNDQSLKTVYIKKLSDAYAHLYQIIKLTKALSEDIHFKLISNELIEKAQNMWAVIQENIEAYQESEVDVIPLQKSVKFSGLWYALNAFNVIPKHIQSLRNTTYLTEQDLNELHISAKKASLSIEQLISSSNSYFKLFLQTPNMIGLYREFKGRLAEFINTVHDTAKCNLGEFHHHVFTPMLIEADHWEDKLGFAPGTFSGPLKKILDEYYKGLLHPLKLHSHTHISFVCDKTPLRERTEITQRNLIDATRHLQNLEKNYQRVLHLSSLIEQYEQLNGAFLIPAQNEVQALLRQIIPAYKVALPRLVRLNRVLKFAPEQGTAQEQQFDAYLNASLKEYDIKLTNIQELVKLGCSHYLGLKKTYAIKLNTAKEKLVYLTQLSTQQKEENASYVENYTTESYNRHYEELSSRYIGLQYVDKEYKTKLNDYILSFKDNIIQQAKSTFDINLSICELLKEKIRHFEQDKFVKFHQLDSIRVALAQFQNYFSLSTVAIAQKSALYENETTVAKKTKEIKKLVDIVENELLSVDERIERIKNQVIKNPNFTTVILEQKRVDTFSFAYLALCFLSLLAALHLYSPAKNARLNDLKNATSQQHTITDLTSRFGLFMTTKKAALSPVQLNTAFEEEQPITPLVAVN